MYTFMADISVKTPENTKTENLLREQYYLHDKWVLKLNTFW